MARKRMIDPNFWIDEKLGTCDPMARFTFMGLISQADDEGRLNGHPALIKSLIFPYDYGITTEQVNEWLSALQTRGLIVRYEVSGQSYISIPNFLKHQTINKPTASKLPAPPDGNQGPGGGGGNDPEPLPDDYGSTPSQKKRKEVEKKEKGKEVEAEVESTTADNPFTFYEKNFGVLGSFIAEEINDWCKTLNDELVIEAMKRTLSQNHRKWKYAASILRDWHGKGIKTVAEAEAEKQQFQQQKGHKVVPLRDNLKVDKLPESVQWQMQQEKGGAIHPSKGRLLQDDPVMMEKLERMRKSRTASR